MSPIFGNPFRTPSTSKYTLPFMKFLSRTTPAQNQVASPHIYLSSSNGKSSEKTNDCIYAKILVILTQEFGDDLLALFAHGSRIYGNACPHSDVDVDVLIKPHKKCRRNIIEMFIHPPTHIRNVLKNDPTGIFLKCYAFGRIIYDPSNILPTFQNLAKKRWEAGPPALEDKDRWRPRYEIADLLRDLEDIDYVQNEATAHFLLVKLVERLVRIQERLWNRWPEKLKRCVEGWETWDDSGGKLAKKVLNSNVKWNERLMCAKDLAKYVLGPIGGIMPTEWNMEWEELQESYNPFTIPNIIPKLEIDEQNETCMAKFFIENLEQYIFYI
ncbi:11979_t:CDS:2 [Entrophospora sp. SA101]|nr:11129_t:CDS:2 [Entrophospora sp. SA101]CAJ0639733.1 11652_t:CDS:2 [Entrophospora sp. SA101]CAJ0747946.1 11979_t:CDS:2 [Entrophospora sp. SA101]CAJ0844433.1 11335_t:CDS:2 [Entrophospora sp. SA101]CAJ0914913.1 18352_t:CDS:2 [Entrophospora sp. SA101]